MQWSALALNRRSPVPLYYQLAELIRERIRAGELHPGDQLPPERDLAEQAAISRMTARQALAYLVRDGTLIVKHGVGAFVAEPKLTYDALHLAGFSEEIMRRGGNAISRVLEQGIIDPPPRVLHELQLTPGELVVKIIRLRLLDTTPLLFETSYIPASSCRGLEQENLTTQSLYTLLRQRYGLNLVRARQTLEATTANAYEHALFGVEAGMPMILVEGVTYDERDRAVEYFKVIYRGDRFKFALESQRDAVLDVAGAVSRLSVVMT